MCWPYALEEHTARGGMSALQTREKRHGGARGELCGY